ncbi:MAG: ArnT family glycosyltransferase [Gemmobacter sp.]
MQKSEGAGWLRPAASIVGAITLARLVLLAFDRTDLFVDEAQYWLWGQSLDWGYYSKPPLIAWVIRGVTGLAGSDAVFWVRMPGAVLHGITAMVLGAVAAALFGGRAAVVTAAGYATLPMVAVGSFLFSTDTVMLPCLAVSLWAWLRVVRGGGLGFAALAGAALGLAVMAKYAGVYGLIGYALAAVLVPGWRAGWRHWAVMGALALVVVAPNIAWNLAHDMTTLAHTADNARWVRGGVALRPGEMLGFWAAQLAVVGPVVALAFVLRVAGARGDALALAVMALVPLAVVTVQALLGGANANWAAAGWLYGAVLAFGWLAGRPVWRALSFGVNGLAAVAVPLLAAMPWVTVGDQVVMARYLGRVALSEAAIAAARGQGAAILADRRDVLADLFHTGRDAGVAVFAPPPAGRPGNFYEQVHALPDPAPAPLLLVAEAAPDCARDLGAHDGAGGAYRKLGLRFWLLEEGCDAGR